MEKDLTAMTFKRGVCGHIFFARNSLYVTSWVEHPLHLESGHNSAWPKIGPFALIWITFIPYKHLCVISVHLKSDTVLTFP